MRRFLPVLLAFSPLALAEPPDPKAEYPAKLEALRKKTATAHAQLGSWCASKKIHEDACREFRRAAALDPGNAEAQKGLGKKKEGDAWVPDPKAAPRTRNEGAPDTWRAAHEEYEKKKKTLSEKAAKEFEALAQAVAKAGLEAEARALWKEILREYDSAHEKARAALGYAKQGEAWVGAGDAERRKAAAARVAAADGGKPVAEESETETMMGWKLTKRRSAHFFVEAKVADAQVEGIAKLAEAARAEFAAMFELDEKVLPPEIHGIFGANHDDYKAYIDRVPGLKDEERQQLKLYGQKTFYRFTSWIGHNGPNTDSFLRDSALHHTAHLLAWRASAGMKNDVPAWFNEGLAWWFTDRFNASAATYCMNIGTGAGGRDLKNPLLWREAILEGLRDGTDPDLRELLNVGYNGLAGVKSVKCWSVMDWLLSVKLAELRKAWGDWREGKEVAPALMERLGVKDYEEMDAAWEAWVLENY
jgi:tetratricopeptide (TPR) repeat protein